MDARRTIVVAIDFSQASMDALSQGARLASQSSAALHVLHVVDSLAISDLAEATGQPIDRLMSDVTNAARKDLERALESQALDVRSARLHVIVGTPLEDIAEYTRAQHASLLIMGRTGRTGKGPRTGALAMAAARRINCDVLLVPQGQRQAFQSIVVGIDFSETSDRAMNAAIDLARRENAHIEAVHVFFGPWNRLHYRAPTIEVSSEFQQKYRDTLERQLREFVQQCDPSCRDVQITPKLIANYSSAGYGLVEYLQEIGCDCAVVGTHGRKGIRRWLMGSTAERVLHDAPCSVLVVKPAKEDVS
jgi:universal stress protein E